MILRSLTKHVREQNWGAVFLDFLIVVVGVFIGIQVSNWNEARAEKQTERLILGRLESDFGEIVAVETHYLAVVEDALSGSETLLDLVLGDQASYEMAALCDLMDPPRAFRPAPAPSATYGQLVANGDMRVLTDEALREKLARFESQRDTHGVQFGMAMDTSLTLSRPFWTAVGICDAYRRQPNEKLAAEITAIVASPEYAAALTSLQTQHANSSRAHQATKAFAEEVLAHLQRAGGA